MIIAGQAKAQPTFEYANYPTGMLNLTIYMVMSQGGLGQLNDGADQTWDISSATLVNVGTVTMSPASSTPYANDYPMANEAIYLESSLGDSEYEYDDLSTTGLEAVATDVPSDPDVYSDPSRVVQFPWSYGQSFSDTYASTDGSGSNTWTYSGYGTLITSGGTFDNLMKATSSDGDILFWKESPLHPVLMLGSDGTAILYGDASTAVAEHAAAPAIRLHPVPCGPELTVEGLTAGDWNITDITGRTVLNGRSGSLSRQRIDVSALVPGIYVLNAADGRFAPQRFIKR
jgi:hypothetical protein